MVTRYPYFGALIYPIPSRRQAARRTAGEHFALEKRCIWNGINAPSTVCSWHFLASTVQ